MNNEVKRIKAHFPTIQELRRHTRILGLLFGERQQNHHHMAAGCLTVLQTALNNVVETNAACDVYFTSCELFNMEIIMPVGHPQHTAGKSAKRRNSHEPRSGGNPSRPEIKAAKLAVNLTTPAAPHNRPWVKQNLPEHAWSILMGENLKLRPLDKHHKEQQEKTLH